MNIISLIFPDDLHHIAGKDFGIEVYQRQIKDKIIEDEQNILKFPEQVRGVSISFIQGLLSGIQSDFSPLTQQLLTLKGSTEKLDKRLDLGRKF